MEESTQTNNTPSVPAVRIGFVDFWTGFDPHHNFILALLRSHFHIELSEEPEFLIFSSFGREHERFDCTKIFITGENVRPDLTKCDYAFGFDVPDSPRHCRWPMYAWYQNYVRLLCSPRRADTIAAAKTKFCCMVVSNALARERIDLFHRLSLFCPVDSGGKVLNNVGGPVSDKLAFMLPYRFAIAYENACYPGYTTEKLVEAFVCGCIPIYWGNPLVGRDFNTAAMVCRHDFESDEAMMNRIIALESDERLYRQCLEAPVFPSNRLPTDADPARVLARFSEIFSSR